MKLAHIAGVAACAVVTNSSARAGFDLVVLDQFPAGLGQLVSCAYNADAKHVWVYNSFDTVISRFDVAGNFLNSVPRPGESANDVDLEVAPEALTLGSVNVPAGTLIFINGESGVADLYAIDPASGSVLSTLATSFGVSHVVGGGYHQQRDTFFLVQDQVPGGVNANRVAEINPVNGAVINSFQTTAVYSVNFGDLDVHAATGNLLLVSSAENSMGEFTPDGAFVATHPLPAGVSGLSGIGVHDAHGIAWVSGTGGSVWLLCGLPSLCAPADINCDNAVNVDDLLEVINQWGACKVPGDCDADTNCTATVDVDDLLEVINSWS